MSLSISYMGTKRHLVPDLKNIISSCRPGMFLDVFSGMCSVGQALAPERQVWSNDLQHFSHVVASTQFCAGDLPISRFDALGKTAGHIRSKVNELSSSLSALVAAEQRALCMGDIDALAAVFDRAVKSALSHTDTEDVGEYSLFCHRYAGTYFGYQQAIEIDSIRYAIDRLERDGDLTTDQHQALIVALCIAMSRCSNSTGHFAQALYPKSNNLRKVTTKRQRSITAEWLDSISDVVPLGNVDWRRQNRAFRSDATELLKSLAASPIKPAVVYADPPYTKDQYSRYYHIYETAVLYDYPVCSGVGLYRPDRPSSPFSLASKVEEALDALLSSVASLGSCFVLSYPQDGLLGNSVDVIPKMIKSHFGIAPDSVTISHKHSTMGGSNGASVHDVTEVIYRVMK